MTGVREEKVRDLDCDGIAIIIDMFTCQKNIRWWKIKNILNCKLLLKITIFGYEYFYLIKNIQL